MEIGIQVSQRYKILKHAVKLRISVRNQGEIEFLIFVTF